MKIEDEVQFAHVSEVLVQNFHKGLHKFKHNQLVFILIDNGNEVEAGEPLVDDLVLFVIEKIAHFWISGDHQLVHLHNIPITSFRMRCFSVWLRLEEYHLVKRERPCRLIRKKQWIIMGCYKYY